MINLTHLSQIFDTAERIAEEEGLFFFAWAFKGLIKHWQNNYILDTIILALVVFIILFLWFFGWGYTLWRRKWIQKKWRKYLQEEKARESRR